MTQIILSLFDPNTLLPHRAGIAGLALALDALSSENTPLFCTVTEEEVQLSWEGSDRDAITWLVRQTYQIEEGYLNVPALNLDLQGRYTFTQGITSTLLQHGQQRTLDSNTKPLRFSVEEGQPEIALDFRPLIDCYYTRDLKDAFNAKGKFKPGISLKGHHLPGLVECFINGAYQETPAGFIALLFLPLACAYYKLPGGRSALVIPEVTNLKQWTRRRQNLSGRTYRQFRSCGAGEAGLRFLLQEKTISDALDSKIDYCEVYQLGSQAWDTSQSYLKQAVYRVRATDEVLALYQSAVAFFPPVRVKTTDKGETWVATSSVLPWIANNLIATKRWYEGFYEFRKANQQLYEREGLIKMKKHLHDEERVLFEAVRGAFSTYLRRQILQAQKQGRKLDYGQVTDKVVYRFQSPKTKQEFATALVKFLSQNRTNAAVGQGLEIYQWLHLDENWRKARDLALLAVATYQSKSKANLEGTEPDSAIELEVEAETNGFEINVVSSDR